MGNWSALEFLVHRCLLWCVVKFSLLPSPGLDQVLEHTCKMGSGSDRSGDTGALTNSHLQTMKVGLKASP